MTAGNGHGQGLLEVRTVKLEPCEGWAVADICRDTTVPREGLVLKSRACSAVVLIIYYRKSPLASYMEHTPWHEDILMVLSLLFHQEFSVL